MTVAAAEPRVSEDGRTAAIPSARRWTSRVPGAAAGWAVAVAGVASLLTACVILSARKWMWYDEVLTSLLVNDPSWRHMMTAITTGVEAAPPLYHFLARAWIAVFGGTPLSLRLFTATGLSAALLILWSALSRVFPWRAVAVGVLAVFCGSNLFFDQIAEVRYYGLLTALVAVALLLCHRVMMSDAPPRRLLVANSAVQACLVLTHVYGGLYSAALLGALVVWDVARGVVAPRRWVAYPLGWLVLVPWLGVYQAQRGSVVRSWMTVPNLGDLRDAYRFQMATEVVPFALIAAVLLAAAASALGSARRPASVGAATSAGVHADGRGAMLVIAGGLLVVPVMSFVVSHLVVPIFFPRYLIAVAYAPAILIAYVVTGVSEGGRGTAAGAQVSDVVRRVARPIVAVGWTIVFAVLLIWPVSASRRWPRTGRPGEAIERLRVDGAPVTSVPIVIENAFDYLPIMAYTTLPQSAYTFVRDSAVALAPNSHHREMLSYALMTLYRRLGYTGGHIEDVDRFLCAHDRFLVVDSPEANWYDRRVAHDSAFVRTELGRTDPTPSTPGAVIWLVRRVPGASPVVCGRPAQSTTGATAAGSRGPV